MSTSQVSEATAAGKFCLDMNSSRPSLKEFFSWHSIGLTDSASKGVKQRRGGKLDSMSLLQEIAWGRSGPVVAFLQLVELLMDVDAR